MSRPVFILRPDPGGQQTAARIAAAGMTPRQLPLFDIIPLDWKPPRADAYDALLLTSANAVRHGGDGLRALRTLPVRAVGEATARAARAAGFRVARTGNGGLADLLASESDEARLLWLAGQERTATVHGAIRTVIPVYAAAPRTLRAQEVAALADGVALVHSARAARHLASEIERHGLSRAAIRVAALSANAATALGPGWGRLAVAEAPDDDALIESARALAIDP